MKVHVLVGAVCLCLQVTPIDGEDTYMYMHVHNYMYWYAVWYCGCKELRDAVLLPCLTSDLLPFFFFCR